MSTILFSTRGQQTSLLVVQYVSLYFSSLVTDDYWKTILVNYAHNNTAYSLRHFWVTFSMAKLNDKTRDVQYFNQKFAYCYKIYPTCSIDWWPFCNLTPWCPIKITNHLQSSLFFNSETQIYMKEMGSVFHGSVGRVSNWICSVNWPASWASWL